MGTVPDPLRSAKLSLVTACEEENSLRELQSPECQNIQASIERNSNGYPFPAKGQPAGEHLFEVKYAAEPNVPRGERQCGYDTHQPTMFSPGSLSLSREGCRAALEPVVNSEQEASHGDKGRAPAEGCTSVQAVAEVPASQEANQNVHSGAGGQHYSGIDQASGGVVESKAHNPSSSAHLNAQHVAPGAKEIVGEMVGLEKTQAPASAKELKPVSDLGVKALACSDAELKGTKDTSSQPSARSGSEVESKTNLESPPQPSCNDQTVEKAVLELSKFKDTGTMTVPPEDGSADGEVRNRACRDAEVQAVASVESKSASTSPSILMAFLRESMPSEAKQKQEQLRIIYTGAGGKEQSEMVDNLAVLVQTVPSILPEVCIQAPAAVEGWLGAQAVRRQDDLEGTGDAIRSALVDNAQHPCPLAPGSPQETAVQRTEVQRADMAGSHSDVSQPLSDNSILLKTRPVYQITVNPSNQSVAPSHPVNIEIKLPPSSTPPEISSKPQHLRSSATENQQVAPSCHRVTEKTDAVTTMAGVHGSCQGEQLPAKTVGDFEIGPDGFHVDVKPKREVQLIHLDPRQQEASNTGAAAGPHTTCAPISAQRELNTFPGNKKEATAAGSWNLAIGLEAELSRNSVPGLGTQNNETRKGPKLDLPAAHASAKPVPNLGGKKKDLKSATEAKVQLKQSKYVRDVVWDEQGMTWEVYGASLDPESLGIAIQNHLQRQIREHEKLIKAQSPQTRKSISSDTSSNKKLKGRQQNVFQSMLQNFRRPNCCVRPAASSVLD